MKLHLKGRNLPITDELRLSCARRFSKVDKQVSELAELDIVLSEARNRANPNSQIAEATLRLKGVTLRAEDASPDMHHTINLISEELARQVKRHNEKRRRRRSARAAKVFGVPMTPPAADGLAASPEL